MTLKFPEPKPVRSTRMPGVVMVLPLRLTDWFDPRGSKTIDCGEMLAARVALALEVVGR